MMVSNGSGAVSQPPFPLALASSLDRFKNDKCSAGGLSASYRLTNGTTVPSSKTAS